MSKETQRAFEANFKQSSVCVDDENCPLKAILTRIELSEEGFLALAQSTDQGVFTSVRYVKNEEGKFHNGEITASCRRKALPFACGKLTFKIAYPEPIPEEHM